MAVIRPAGPDPSLPPTVRLGQGVIIEDARSFRQYRSTRQPGLVLGDRVTVFSWTEFSVEPGGVLEIGADTVLVGAIFMCAQRITVGRGVVVSYGVSIADCDFHPIDPGLRRQDAMAITPGAPVARVPVSTAPVVIGDGARLGVGAIVLKGVTIGAGAQVGPGAVVTEPVPPGATVLGNPARIQAGDR